MRTRRPIVSSCFLFLLTALSVSLASEDCPCALLDRPDLWKKEQVARWMVHSLDWGVLTTLSSRIPNTPFGNVYSFVDGPCDDSTGVPYFYGTYMDQSFQDMQVQPQASFTLTEASFATVCGAEALPACTIVSSSHHQQSTSAHHRMGGDPEFPICARLTLTGTLVQVDADSDEYIGAQRALFERHQSMKSWPDDHNWIIAKLEIEDIWLIDYFGGASILSVDDYMAVELFPKER